MFEILKKNLKKGGGHKNMKNYKNPKSHDTRQMLAITL